MEAAGIALGVAGIAGLFTFCVDCFELIQRGRYLGKDYLLLETKYSNQRLRLLTWGQACGITETRSDDVFHDSIIRANIRANIRDTLLHIIALLNDGDGLKKNYGLKKETEMDRVPKPVGMMMTSLTALAPSLRVTGTSLSRGLQGLRDRATWTRRSVGAVKTTRWAIEDKRKFTELVQHLKDLIDDLENLTRPLDVSRHQRKIIQSEVDSISDVVTLETIEKARIGRIDVVSDVASLRLWTIRDQYSENVPAHTTSAQINQGQDQENGEWEDLAEKGKLTTSDADDVCFQVVHRVICSDEPPQFYLDVPSYRTSSESNEQWVLFEQNQPACAQRSLHLGGSRAIADLETYLQHNDRLLFLHVTNYMCTHERRDHDNSDTKLDSFCIYLSSPDLCAALEVLSKSLDLEYLPTFLPKMKISAPFIWYYHARKELKRGIKCFKKGEKSMNKWCERNDEETWRGVDALFNHLDDLMAEEFSVVDGLLSQGEMCWNYLSYAFEPGATILDKRREYAMDTAQAYELVGLPIPREEDGRPYLDVQVRAWLFDGLYKQIQRSLSLPRSKFWGDSDNFKVPLNKLHVTITNNEDGPLLERLRTRCCFRPQHLNWGQVVTYTGGTDAQEDSQNPERRFMVNLQTYHQLHELPQQKDEPNRQVLVTTNVPPTDGWLWLPPRVMAFDMQDRQWYSILVVKIMAVTWRPSLFERLLVNQQTKEILKAIVSSSPTDEDEAGQSSVILFHGAPGTGKSTAAESLAEVTQKALYRLTMADLGSTAVELEKAFKATVSLTQGINCIILLEDADALVETRRTENLSQNAILSTFTRLVDDFKGTLVLTSTRVGTLDEGFRLRLDLKVHFAEGTASEQRNRWATFLHQITTTQEYEAIKKSGFDDPLLSAHLRIPEIRKAISIARRLARYEKRTFEGKDFFLALEQIKNTKTAFTN